MKAEANITVSFVWDNGDPSVGLWPGWEETCAVIQVGALRAVIGFEVEDGKPASEWTVIDAETDYGFSSEHTRHVARLGSLTLTLGDLPEICEAVEKVWVAKQAIEELNTLGENAYAAESYRDSMMEWDDDRGWHLPSEHLKEYEELKRESDAAHRTYERRKRELQPVIDAVEEYES